MARSTPAARVTFSARAAMYTAFPVPIDRRVEDDDADLGSAE
jgi:hypothetical protein